MPNHCHLANFYQSLALSIDRPNKLVLLTIIETFGSSYQKIGAKAVLTPYGKLVGLLSGGCLEQDLILQAQSLFEHGFSKTVFYDFLDQDKDVLIGHGLGCLGAIKVFLQCLDIEADYFPLNQISHCYNGDSTAILASVLESQDKAYPQGISLFISTTDLQATENGGIQQPLIDAAQRAMGNNKPSIEIIHLNGKPLSVFFEPLKPPIRLLLIGAGQDAQPVAQFASALGWRVTLVDHRPALISQFNIDKINNIITLTPNEMTTKLDLNGFDAAVIMTHNLEFDGKFLAEISSSGVPYVGLLGPAQRKAKLLDAAGDVISDKLVNRLHGPVGLNIGAETPAEIALSIVAGIQASLSEKSRLGN